MYTYTTITAYYKKEKQFFGVRNIDFENNLVGVFDIKSGKKVEDLKLTDVYFFVGIDIMKLKKQKADNAIFTAFMSKTIVRKKKG
jgi:hypothetical protein